jgi:hypothetical protein
VTANRAIIQQTATTLFRPDTVVEIRVLNTPRNGTVSGYFNALQSFVQAASQWSGQAPAVYTTLNPCNPALLARAANRLKERVKTTTSDSDIIRRYWLPLDFDPVRPADISSTDAEHDAALQRAAACVAWLHSRGWPAPVAADSGNGGHNLYAIDLPNDDASRVLLQRCLEGLALYFSDDTVALDLTVFNAARVWKVYGTLVCKGDNLPERPHRLARLLDVPAPLEIVTRAQLEVLAALVPDPPKTVSRSEHNGQVSFNLEQWITDRKIPVVSRGKWGSGGSRWILNPCPWNGAHTNRSAFIVQFVSGAIAAGCHHHTCSGNDWHALRELFEPGWQPRIPPATLHVSGPATTPAASVPGQGGNVPTNVWDHAITAQEFLQQSDADLPATVKDLVVPGCITVVVAPRASGKTLVALYLGVALATGGVFRGERLKPTRILLVDRDNPPALIRKRLRWLGAQTVTALKVLIRDKAPPLTDKAAWNTFPVQDYEVVIVDSLGASTEGISEKEGRQTQEFLATLKDLARRGPALLCLDNTTKAATNYRGRGEKGDAVDILYECRNITGWTPSQAGDWWEDLPDFGEHTWQQRATRRTGQAVLRMAFIPSKFRLGIEPEPFVLEIDTRVDPWTLTDVTAEIATAGTRAAEEMRRQEQTKIAHAEEKLVQAIAARAAASPLLKEEAVILLQGYGLTRKAARTLLESRGNHDVSPQGQWVIRPIPGHQSGKALGVYPAGEKNDGEKSNVIQFPRQYTPPAPLPSAVGSALDGERSVPTFSSNNAPLNGADLSLQPDYSTAEGDTPADKQPCGYSQAGGPFYVPTLSSDAPAQVLPCALCGGIERWDDHGIWRCLTCWPRVASRTPQAPPHDA